MKNQHSSLFLYGNAQGLSQLKSGVVPLLSDWSLLEPYLHCAQFQTSIKQTVTEAEIIRGLEQEYQKLPADIKVLLAWQDFLQQRDKFEANIRARILTQRSHETQAQGYNEARFQQLRFLRLFASATCHFGWQTLADDFSGVCLEIKSNAKCLSAREGELSMLKPVNYGREHDYASTAQNPIPGAFEDAPEHQGRGEWRFVCPAKQAEQIKLTKLDVSAIYVSIATPIDLVDALRELIALDLRYRHCRLYEVYPDASTWRLTARVI